MSVWKSKI